MKTVFVSADEKECTEHILNAIGKIRKGGMQLVARKCLTEEELEETAKDAEIIWFWGRCPGLTESLLPKLPCLKAIFRSGSGLDAIPVEECTKRGIAVCNTPESISEAVAEHAAALLHALAKKIPAGNTAVREGSWPTDGAINSVHLTGRTLGLVGYGRIARRLEEILSGYRMRVLFHDPFVEGSASLEEVLKEADFLSLHCPLTEATRHWINKDSFARMKKTALLINTSRGAVIDEEALAEALKKGEIAGAALDVTENEPLEKTSPLRELPNVIITPHTAPFTDRFQGIFWECSADKVLALLKGDFRKESTNLR